MAEIEVGLEVSVEKGASKHESLHELTRTAILLKARLEQSKYDGTAVDLLELSADDYAETPLHTAARLGMLDSLVLLLEYAATANPPCDLLLGWDANCQTPLGAARAAKQTEAAALLSAYPLKRRLLNEKYVQAHVEG